MHASYDTNNSTSTPKKAKFSSQSYDTCNVGNIIKKVHPHHQNQYNTSSLRRAPTYVVNCNNISSIQSQFDQRMPQVPAPINTPSHSSMNRIRECNLTQTF